MNFNFIDNLDFLFSSLVIYCSISLFYLVFLVNDKSQAINKLNLNELKNNKESSEKIINTKYDFKRKELIKKSKKVLMWILFTELLANILIIIIKNYLNLLGWIAGIVFPLIAYLIIVFIMLIAIGLKGERVLIIRGLIHGR